MEEKIIEETEEVLENNAGNVPEELKKYLEADEKTLNEIENVLTDLSERKTFLENQKEDTEKEFERRLKEFTENLEKEKEEVFNNISNKEKEIEDEKSRVESIKLKEQGNQVNFVDSLVEISNKFNSKISSIEDAIKACEDNDTLNKALEEEKNKLEDSLEKEYASRKEDLAKVLEDVGIKKEETKPVVEEKEPMPDIDIDFNVPDYTEEPVVEHVVDPGYLNNMEDENEVVEHEPREDVINEIYQSKDVMEGHVFPYLKSIME